MKKKSEEKRRKHRELEVFPNVSQTLEGLFSLSSVTVILEIVFAASLVYIFLFESFTSTANIIIIISSLFFTSI